MKADTSKPTTLSNRIHKKKRALCRSSSRQYVWKEDTSSGISASHKRLSYLIPLHAGDGKGQIFVVVAGIQRHIIFVCVCVISIFPHILIEEHHIQQIISFNLLYFSFSIRSIEYGVYNMAVLSRFECLFQIYDYLFIFMFL